MSTVPGWSPIQKCWAGPMLLNFCNQTRTGLTPLYSPPPLYTTCGMELEAFDTPFHTHTHTHTCTQAQLLEQSANAAAAASSNEPPKKGKGRKKQSDDKYFVYSPDDDISSSEEDTADGPDEDDSDDSEPEFSKCNSLPT